MFITAVDAALEKFLRAVVPATPDSVEVSFDAPTPDWAAQLTRPTVNLFLYAVERTNQTARAPQRRFDANGRPERRGPQPLIELSYAVTAWAPDASAEHGLLGHVIAGVSAYPTLPPQFVPETLRSGVNVVLGDSEQTRPAAPFAMAGPMKAYALLSVTAGIDLPESGGDNGGTAAPQAVAPVGDGLA